MIPTPTLRELIAAATPGPYFVWPNAELIRRCNPATMQLVLEALIDAHLYIDDGLEGSPVKRKAMLLQIETALQALNATGGKE